MSRLPISNADFISFSDKKNDFLDVQFHYTIPTNENINIENCIVTSYTANGVKRFYKTVNFFTILTQEKLNDLFGDFAYVSVRFNDEERESLMKKIEKRFA